MELDVVSEITTTLCKENITEAALKKMKEEYMPLKIQGEEDSEGYAIVRAARLHCKSLRVATVKVCKKGRESAQEIVKAWIAKEKEIVGQIENVESYLDVQEKAYEEAKEKAKEAIRKAQEAALVERNGILLGLGAEFTGAEYILEDVTYSIDAVKNVDADIWEGVMFPKYKAIFDRNEAARIADENKKKEEQERLGKEQAELKRQQEELRQQQEALELQRKEVERQKEEADRAERIRKDQDEEKRWRSRLSELLAISFNGQEAFYKDDSNVVATHKQLIDLSNEEFAAIKEKHNAMVEAERVRFESRQQRLSDIGLVFDPIGFRYAGLGIPTQSIIDSSDAHFDKLIETTKAFIAETERTKRKEQEEHEASIRQKAIDDEKERLRQEEVKRQEELAQSTDAERWKAFVKDLAGLKLPQCKSSRYKKIATIAFEKIEEIKNLKA